MAELTFTEMVEVSEELFGRAGGGIHFEMLFSGRCSLIISVKSPAGISVLVSHARRCPN